MKHIGVISEQLFIFVSRFQNVGIDKGDIPDLAKVSDVRLGCPTCNFKFVCIDA